MLDQDVIALIDKQSDHWYWTGDIHEKGYPLHGWDLVHRDVYEEFVGPIKPGHEVHHRCEVKLCVMPEHLEQLNWAQHKARHYEANGQPIPAGLAAHLPTEG